MSWADFGGVVRHTFIMGVNIGKLQFYLQSTRRVGLDGSERAQFGVVSVQGSVVSGGPRRSLGMTFV